MRRTVIVLIFGMFSFVSFSQRTNYAVAVNLADEDFKLPLIGFCNIARGNHNGLQLGFVNTNTGNFRGCQSGFVNTTWRHFSGLQEGFVNTTWRNFSGLQTGFVSTAWENFSGAQVSFLNVVSREAIGCQVGFVNIAKKKLNGLQFGFINYTDTIEKGISIGFLSIVRHGGYRAVEYSFSEFYPVTASFKSGGNEKFYGSVFFAYNPSQTVVSNSLATGFGFGSIISIKKSVFFNPELNGLFSLSENSKQLTSFIPYFGYNFDKHFSITAGPSVTWSRSNKKNDFLKPVFSIANIEMNANNSLVFSARIGVRYRF